MERSLEVSFMSQHLTQSEVGLVAVGYTRYHLLELSLAPSQLELWQNGTKIGCGKEEPIEAGAGL